MSDIVFPVKQISWSAYEQKTPILLQEDNGPCPLIALVNTLLMKSDVDSRTTALEDPFSAPVHSAGLRALLNEHVDRTVSLEQVLGCLGEMLLEMPLIEPEVVKQLLESLPLLHTGLTVNPNVTTGQFPFEDLAATIFRAFGLTFVHAWVCQPGELDAALDKTILRLQTFDALQDYMLTTESEEKEAVAHWFAENSTQLTCFGLAVMESLVEANSVAVFFRNNHFSTIYKGTDHDFYLLLTDMVFFKRPKFVWQSMVSASGTDDLFFTGDFVPLDDEPNTDTDLAMVRQLQEEEDAAMAKNLQSNYNAKTKRASNRAKNEAGPNLDLAHHDGEAVTGGDECAGHRVNSTQNPASDADAKEKKKKKRGNCVIM